MKLTDTLSFPRPATTLEFTGERYVSGIVGNIQHEHYHRYLFAADLCRGRTVLDIACGEGYGCYLLGQVAKNVIGADIDLDTIDYARVQYKAPNLDFLVCNATAIPLVSASVDVVTSFETIEHLQGHEVFLAEIYRVLRPGGTLVISSPNRPVYTDQNQHKNEFHVRELDREEFRSALQARFEHVALFEQRPMAGSVLVAEGPDAGGLDAFESSDGLSYRHNQGVPSPIYFVAVASSSPLPEVNGSLLINSEYVASLQREIARKTVDEADLGRREAELTRTEAEIVERQAEIAERQAEIAERQAEIAERQARLARAEAELSRSIAQRVGIRLKAAWRHPRNSQKRKAFRAECTPGNGGGNEARPRSRFFTNVRAIIRFPLSPDRRRAWREKKQQNRASNLLTDARLYEAYTENSMGRFPASEYVARSGAPPILPPGHAKVIAYYLPQFHPVPENDEWWGEGFTEWRNVARAFPVFDGHYQPRIPGDFGYYDLRITDNIKRQVELARQYGVSAFCFHFYWFGGKRLLELPLLSFLDNKDLDLQFSLCWANENWSRRWDGGNNELLIAQQHSPEDDIAFIRYLEKYFRDERYQKVEGKPVLTVYRADAMPNMKETVERWRDEAVRMGFPGLYLIATNVFNFAKYREYGFDALSEFPPNHGERIRLKENLQFASANAATAVFSYPAYVESEVKRPGAKGAVHPGVMLGWDNSARRPYDAQVFHGATPALFRRWLGRALERAAAHPENQRFVFINAWNEWAEGTYLEPDARYGYAWLQALRDALEGKVDRSAVSRSRVVIVSHDAHPHGAQYLAMHMARTLGTLGIETDMIVLGNGALLPSFAEVATVHQIDLRTESEAAVVERLEKLRSSGAEVALANTTVSGLLVPLLKRAGFLTVSLVHELPGVLSEYKLQRHARAIAEHADKVVFAAQIVRDGFEEFIEQSLQQAIIRRQGVLRSNPFKGRHEEASRAICERHGFPSETRFIIAVAFVDDRKGPDLFVKAAEKILTTHPETAFIWVGHPDRKMQEKVDALIDAKNLSERVRFVGFVAEPLDYYAAASVYALTSREDPFPNVVLESAEVGVPVVAFEGATGAADFIIEQGGRLVRPFDVDDFAAQVVALLDTPTHADRTPVGSLRRYLLDILHHATGHQRVSVVVPNYNYAHHLVERLASVAAQTYLIYELIILDDASTDSSVKVVKDFLAATPGLDSDVVVNSANSGSVFRQWQKGLARCSGDLVWIAEADDLADPAFLSELVATFADPGTVLAFSQSRQIDDKGMALAADYLNYTKDISDAWRADYTRNGKDEISDAFAVKNTIPNVSAVLFRREALEHAFTALGDDLFDYRVAGDWLIYMQTLLQGKISFIAKPLNAHRRHGASVTKTGMATRHLEEVAEAQRIASSLAPISGDTRSKADAWLKHVRKYLGLPNENRLST